MRYFWIVLVCLCGVIMPAFAEEAPEDSFAVQAVQYIMHLKEQADAFSPQDAKNYTEYNVFTVPKLITTDANPLSGMGGYGEWYEYPFGQVRLVSCQSAFRPDELVFAAVQTKVKAGWRLKRPVLTLTTPTRQVLISAPVQYPLPKGETRTMWYGGESFFPIMFYPDGQQSEMTVAVHADLTVQSEVSGVQTISVPLQLTLQEKAPTMTGICPMMRSFLSVIPRVIRDEVQIQAIQNDSGDIQLFFDFQKAVKLVSVQVEDDWTFTEVNKVIRGKNAALVIRPNIVLSAGDEIPLTLISSSGLFSARVKIERGNFVQIAPNICWSALLWGGPALFLLTPLFAFFLLYAPRTKKELQAMMTQMVLIGGALGIVIVLLWQAGILTRIDLIQMCPWMAPVLFVLLVWLLYRPQMGLLATWLYFILMPKPYLENIWQAGSSESYFPAVAGCIWLGVMMLPFEIMRRHPDKAFNMYRFLKKNRDIFVKYARVSFGLLLLWLFIGGTVNYLWNQSIPEYNEAQVKQSVSEGKIVSVLIEQPICVRCVLNKISLHSGFAYRLYRRGQMQMMRVNADSLAGQSLLKKNGELTPPTTIFYGSLNEYGLNLSGLISRAKLETYLNSVR